jgi:hypothetical protein
MSAIELVTVVLIIMGTAIAAVLITVAVSSLVEAHRVRLEPLLADARMSIIAALSGEELKAEEALTHLSPFSERYIVGVMLDLAPSVSGTSKSVLVSLGEQIGVLQRARAGVHARRWSTRLYSARVFTAFGVESPDMIALFSDRSPEVRAQAAAWCVATPNPLGIEYLVTLLGDVDGQCRFAAQDALIRIGRPVTEVLLSALGSTDEVVTDRILEVAAAIGDERFFGQAEVLTSDSRPGTRALAGSVLASTGNPSAGPVLMSLLADLSDEVILAATAGLGRLAYWPGATAVEPLLGHPSWEIRKQAAMTLLAMDAPGTILLRADAPGVGPAAAMALQALELQSLSSQEQAA